MKLGSKQRPGRRSKSDAELLRKHGIHHECRVVLSSAFVLNHGDSLMPTKHFQVHYGRHYLWQIAQHFYFYYPVSSIDLDDLYATFITSPFSSLDLESFKKIVMSYFSEWEKDFKVQRERIIRTKLRELNVRLRAEREAQRLCRITYRDMSAIVRRANLKLAKAALKNAYRSRVLLERISLDDASTSSTDDVPVDSPRSSHVIAESPGNPEDSLEKPGSPSSQGAISPERGNSPCCFMYLRDEDFEDRRTAIGGLITDLIAKVSDEQDHDGGASNPDMSSTDCYSDDTVESPMEVEFGSGESPDFSKVLRDSEETCHGDEFYEVSRVKQQSLPNGNADKGSCVIQKTITRSHDKPIVVMKL